MTNTQIKQKAYEAVIAFERAEGRTAVRYERDGYDIRSAGGAEERHIEVKGSTQNRLDWRWLEENEYHALKTDPKFFLYAVYGISDKPGVIPKVRVFTKSEMEERFRETEIKYIFKFKASDFP